MIGKRTEESKPVTLAEVKEILEKRSGEPDFGYEQQTSLDYAKKFAKLDAKKAGELVKKLMEIEGMKEATAVKITDILPKYVSQLSPVLAKENILLSDDDKKKVMEIVKPYLEQ